MTSLYQNDKNKMILWDKKILYLSLWGLDSSLYWLCDLFHWATHSFTLIALRLLCFPSLDIPGYI